MSKDEVFSNTTARASDFEFNEEPDLELLARTLLEHVRLGKRLPRSSRSSRSRRSIDENQPKRRGGVARGALFALSVIFSCQTVDALSEFRVAKWSLKAHKI